MFPLADSRRQMSFVEERLLSRSRRCLPSRNSYKNHGEIQISGGNVMVVGRKFYNKIIISTFLLTKYSEYICIFFAGRSLVCREPSHRVQSVCRYRQRIQRRQCGCPKTKIKQVKYHYQILRIIMARFKHFGEKKIILTGWIFTSEDLEIFPSGKETAVLFLVLETKV